VRYNVTFERLHHQEGEWRSTGSFGRDDLLLLGKVADLAQSWLIEPEAAEAGQQLKPATDSHNGQNCSASSANTRSVILLRNATVLSDGLGESVVAKTNARRRFRSPTPMSVSIPAWRKC